MTERWNYQIKQGLLYGLIMSVLSAGFELQEKTFEEAFMSYRFLIRLLIFIVVGIFLIGYLNWKEKQKQLKK